MNVAAMVNEFGKVLNQAPNPDLYRELVYEEFEEWRQEAFLTESYQPEAELKELADLVYVCYGQARSMGWNLDAAIARVHNNNIGRCIQPDGSIIRRDDGKVVKNPNYPKVDLKDLVQ